MMRRFTEMPQKCRQTAAIVCGRGFRRKPKVSEFEAPDFQGGKEPTWTATIICVLIALKMKINVLFWGKSFLFARTYPCK